LFFLPLCIAAALLWLAPSAKAQTLNAVFNSVADIPVTSAGYDGTDITVQFTLNYAPATGATLTVVNNTSLDFIQVPFSNLAQGQPVALSYGGKVYNFVANYYGGTGNDLVLQWASVVPYGWGANSHGQIGNTNTSDVLAPAAVLATGILSGKTIIAMAPG